jgi:hypothetical protein
MEEMKIRTKKRDQILISILIPDSCFSRKFHASTDSSSINGFDVNADQIVLLECTQLTLQEVTKSDFTCDSFFFTSEVPSVSFKVLSFIFIKTFLFYYKFFFRF